MNNEKCRISWGSSSDKGEKLNKNSSKQYGYHPDDVIIFKIGQIEPLTKILK